MEIMKVTKKEIQKRMRSKRVKNSGPDKTPKFSRPTKKEMYDTGPENQFFDLVCESVKSCPFGHHLR